ncbi:MAG: ferrous iron transport protein A [Deltaproteobacteria bacterium]|nr:ferrous iron transport protein A [Deltaproteobacteria bacterium]
MVTAAKSPVILLDQLRPGAHARVLHLSVDDEQAAWLGALGIFEGQRLSVLRRGLFGGPLHVRSRSGGEFAIDRSLARLIRVVTEFPGRPDADIPPIGNGGGAHG